jgi:hypothetical protein
VLAHSFLLFQDLLGVLSFQTRRGSEGDIRPYDDIFLRNLRGVARFPVFFRLLNQTLTV